MSELNLLKLLATSSKALDTLYSAQVTTTIVEVQHRLFTVPHSHKKEDLVEVTEIKDHVVTLLLSERLFAFFKAR